MTILERAVGVAEQWYVFRGIGRRRRVGWRHGSVPSDGRGEGRGARHVARVSAVA